MKTTRAPLSNKSASAFLCLEKRAVLVGKTKCWEWVPGDPVVSNFSTLLLDFNKSGKVTLSQQLKASLQNQYWNNAARIVKIEHQFIAILKQLDATNIKVIPLKGAALLFLNQQKAGHRPMDDFDILVPPAQFIQAAKLLLNAGLSPEAHDTNDLFEFTALDPQYWPRELHFHNDQGLNIDLHQNLITNHWYRIAFPINIDAVWERSIQLSPISVKNNKAALEWKFALSPYDMLAHLCLHLAWHGLNVMKNFYDIDLFIRNLPEDWQWVKFLEIVNQWQIRNCSYQAFIYCQTFFNTPIPENVLNSLNPGKFKRWQLRLIITPKAILKNKPTIGKRYATIVKFFLFDRLQLQIKTIKTLLSPDSSWMKNNPKQYNLFSHIQHIISVIKRGV